MPAIAAVAIAAGTVGTTAAAAVGIMAAVGTLSGALTIGAAVVGAGLSIAGEVTGSKSLKKAGLGLSVAAGVGSAMGAGRGAGAASAARSADVSTTEGLLSSPTPGTKDVIAEHAFKSFAPVEEAAGGAASFTGDIAQFQGNVEPGIFDRFNNNMNRYNGAINVAGGMADAYMQNRALEVREDIADKNRAFAREVSERDYMGTAGAMPGRSVAFNPTSQGLLRGNVSLPNITPPQR